MNNKGFNWFFPIVIIALLLFFGSNFLGGDTAKSIDEDGFFREMQAGESPEYNYIQRHRKS